jgi:hypothetical protein
MANWIASKDNRDGCVMVNRIWQHHFGTDCDDAV